MKKSEVALVLGTAAAFDLRTVGEADIEAWYAILAEYPFGATKTAVVDWYRENRERIMPCDLIERVPRQGKRLCTDCGQWDGHAPPCPRVDWETMQVKPEFRDDDDE